ncbi:galactoside-binding lectin, partial [Ancylostoma duodenale]
FYIDGRFTYEFRERQPGFKVRSLEIGGHVERLVIVPASNRLSPSCFALCVRVLCEGGSRKVHFRMARVAVQRLSSEVPTYTHFSKEIFKPPNEGILVFPVTSFTLGDRLRIVLQPMHHTNRKFYQGEEDVTYSAHVFFNTFHNGAWESEEQSAGRYPFVWYRTYVIDFSPSGHHSVYVRVDGRNIHEFRERHNGFKVSSLEIAGDLAVHSVHIP